MVVLDESKDSFVLDVPLVQETEAKLREEERKKTGRYLAVFFILFLVSLGLYQAISYRSTKMSALLAAALIMFLYLLWLFFASYKKNQKTTEIAVDKQVSQVLENMNNVKSLQSSSGSNDNYVYSSSEEESEKYTSKRENQNVQKNKQNIEYFNESFQKETVPDDNVTRKSSRSSDTFIRTYSIA